MNTQFLSKSNYKKRPDSAKQHIGKVRPKLNKDCMPKPRTARTMSQR